MPDIAATVSCRSSRVGGRRAKPLRGFLAALPSVGLPMTLVIPLSDGGVERLVTSLIQRVLVGTDGTLFVETRRSVYRITLDEPALVLPPLSRVRTSFDGFEFTVASDAQAEDTSDGAGEGD